MGETSFRQTGMFELQNRKKYQNEKFATRRFSTWRNQTPEIPIQYILFGFPSRDFQYFLRTTNYSTKITQTEYEGGGGWKGCGIDVGFNEEAGNHLKTRRPESDT